MTNYHESMRFDDRVLNGLGVLAAVVRSGSFAVAGKSLNMSQSGVSRAIARLEARLGVRLLERTTRTVTLSEEGRRLYGQIVPLLAGLEEAAASVATSKDAVRGTLRVNMDPFISQLILGTQLSRFLKQFPALKLDHSPLWHINSDGCGLAEIMEREESLVGPPDLNRRHISPR
jgi:DNA-binding transcriptional LysR family regulator